MPMPLPVFDSRGDSLIGRNAMIHNDIELKATQERITLFGSWVAQFRVAIPPAEFKFMASGYLAEIEKMHAEVMEYLRRHASEPAPSEAA
jgi:hypothetical protein